MSRDPLGERRSDAVESFDEIGGRGVQINRGGGASRLVPGRRAALPAFGSRASRIYSAELVAQRRARRRIGRRFARKGANSADAGAEGDYGRKEQERFSLGRGGHARALPAPEEYCVTGSLS